MLKKLKIPIAQVMILMHDDYCGYRNDYYVNYVYISILLD